MNLLVLMLVLLGPSISLSLYTGWPLEVAPLVISCLTILWLYVWALYGHLQPGFYVWVLLGIIATLPTLSYIRRHRWRCFISLIATPGILVFLFSTLVIWFLSRGLYFHRWDEFSHWGLVITEMVRTHALPTPGGNVLFLDYPPGTALFQYFVAQLIGYTESNIYFAQGLLLVSSATVLLQNYEWKRENFSNIFMTSSLLFLSIFYFKFQPLILHVDLVLSFIFGASLSIIFLTKNRVRSLWQLFPIVLCLPLIKQAGLLLALFIVVSGISCFIASIYPSRVTLKKSCVLLGFLLLLCSAQVSRWSWVDRVDKIKAGPTFKTAHISLAAITGSFSMTRSTERDRSTIAAFSRALYSRSVAQTSALSPLMWVALFFCIIIISLGREKEYSRQFIAFQGTLFLGFLVYSFGLLMLYLYSFGEYEGTRIASFDRYMSIYLLGWCLSLIVALREASFPVIFEKYNKYISPLLVVFLFSVLFSSKAPLQFLGCSNGGLSELRSHVQEKRNKMLPVVPEKSRIYVVWQNTVGFEYYLTRLELSPLQTKQEQCWSLGPRYYPGDVWTCSYTLEKFEKSLENIDFLFIGSADEQFWREYGNLFELSVNVTEKFLFQVVRDKSGRLKLIAVK